MYTKVGMTAEENAAPKTPWNLKRIGTTEVNSVPDDDVYALPTNLRAWFLGKRPGGGAVFWHGTAGNDAYQPSADPPRQALSSVLATASVSFFSPWPSRSKFRFQISE